MLDYVAMVATHVSLALHGQPRPSEEAIACHHCDQSLCVNPDHLYWGTSHSNTMDAYGRGRRVKSPIILAKAAAQRAQTHCKHGHEFTPENTIWQRGGTCRSCKECHRWIVIRSKERGNVSESGTWLTGQAEKQS
jgi:hypothetical protein